MDANQLIARISELQQAVEQSAANHNSLVGRLLETKELLEKMATPVTAEDIAQFDQPVNDLSVEVS